MTEAVDVMRKLAPVIALLGAVVLAAPASAVVGGQRVAASSVPWFVGTGICGGTLIAPDRIATAAHCVDPVDMSDLERIEIAGEARRGVRVSLPPTWRTRRVGFALHDIAIVALDRPVTHVRPVTLPGRDARTPRKVTVVGRGQINAPRRGKTALPGLFPPRRATLKTLSDSDCGRLWKRSRTKYRNRFEAKSELCATDRDGRSPRDSVCAGDSGGPMIGGTLARPILFGVISWTGPRCGADRLPSVAADTRRFHAFLTNPAPIWAPVATGPARIMGVPRVGELLTCVLPAWEQAPERVDVRWLRRTTGADGAYRLVKVGEGSSYTAVAADAGKLVDCEALASNAGGRTLVPLAAGSAVRIAG